VSNDIDLELVRRLHPEEREGRDAARERARADLRNAMHPAGRVSGPPPARRRLRLITLGSTAAALAAGLIVAILLLTATSATAPAYALTRHSDGTLTLKFYRLTNDIPALNARLARMGIDETVVPVTPQCTNQAPIYPIGSAQSTIKLYVGGKYLAPGFQGVLGAERLPDGKIALVQGAMKPWEIPSCFATLSNTNIGHLVIPNG
jgi:hypothetical protein